MKTIIAEFFQVFHRSHECRPKFMGKGDLSNMEFMMLVGISHMLQEKSEEQDVNSHSGCLNGKAGITLGELTESVGMSMSAASKKISILEKKGLLRRQTSQTDRRNVYITLTPEGEALCEKERVKRDRWLTEVIRRLGEEDARKLIDLLNRVFDIMEQMERECKEGSDWID